MGDVIARATAATASLLTGAGPEMIVDVEPGLPAVSGDGDRLIQVVINLISNAVKFTPEGSITCVAVRNPGGPGLTVSVTDTGVGIAPEDHDRVFEQFGQAGDTLSDRPRGTGLGLAICREIVEHHGGRIWLESEAGHGARFSFTLPVETAASAAPYVDAAAT
jgi:signal transduction histidine kinase